MQVKKPATAGTRESSDLEVFIEPGEGGLDLEIKSKVMSQYGKQIEKVVRETLERLEVSDAKVKVFDEGALDCTIKARVECAVYRSNDITEDLPWGGVIR